MDYKKLQNGSDIRGVALEGIEGQHINLTEQACRDIGRGFALWLVNKTGKKDLDYCDIYNGLGLQMLLYLFALQDNRSLPLGENSVPAGVQYFPARVPILSMDGRPDEQRSQEERQKNWKRSGLLLGEDAVLTAMDSSEMQYRLPFSRKKDGTISGDLADRHQMRLLKGYIFTLLAKMVDDISSGCVTPNPYTRGGRHNACAYCPYGDICHMENVTERRDYAKMSSQMFWEHIEKEMSGCDIDN